jgi:molecular chaperone GrpE
MVMAAEEAENKSDAEAKLVEETSQVEALLNEVTALREALDKQKASAEQYLDMAKRIQADFDNYRKRAQREREEFMKSANDRLILDLLVIVDDLERAMNANAAPEEFRKGVAQVQFNLSSILGSYGLRQMPSDDRFDPNLHEVLCTEEGEEGKILETYQKGYLMGPLVIRHAKVKVGKKVERGEQND